MKPERILSALMALVLLLCMIACDKPVSEQPVPQQTASEQPVPLQTASEPPVTEQPAATETAATITVTDMMGRVITLSEPATKVVAVTASDCEILYALGAGQLLVGRGEYCDYPPEVMEVASVQSGYETNIEQIIALEPQLVLMGTMNQSVEQLAALESAGIAVAVSEAVDIEGVYRSIEIIGALVGYDSQAESLVSSMRTQLETLSSSATGDGTKTVYFEVSPLQWGLWTAGSGTFMNEIAELLGVKNAFADVTGWAEISEEQVIERNPDYIVTISMYYGEGPTPTEELLARAGWQEITAIKNAAILNLQNNELSRPVPRLVEGAQLMSDFIYGKAE